MTCNVDGLDVVLTTLGLGPWTYLFLATSLLVPATLPIFLIGSEFINPPVPYTCHLPGPAFTPYNGSECYMVQEVNGGGGGGGGGMEVEVEVVACTSWLYNTSVNTSTVSMEWDLVCERAGLSSLFQTLYTVGCVFGSILSGILADRYGRRWTVRVGAVGTVTGVVLLTATPWLSMVFLARFLLGVLNTFMVYPAFMLSMEVCVPELRAKVGVVMALPYAIMMIALAGLAYCIREWRTLQAVASLPCVILLPVLYFVDESPRWLLVQGRVKEVVKVLKRAGELHGVTIPEADILTATVLGTSSEDDSDPTPEEGTGTDLRANSAETDTKVPDITSSNGRKSLQVVCSRTEHTNNKEDSRCSNDAVTSPPPPPPTSRHRAIRKGRQVKLRDKRRESVPGYGKVKEGQNKSEGGEGVRILPTQQLSSYHHGNNNNTNNNITDHDQGSLYHNTNNTTTNTNNNNSSNNTHITDNGQTPLYHNSDNSNSNNNNNNNPRRTLGIEDGRGSWWVGPVALVRTPVIRKLMLVLIAIWILQGVVYLGLPLSCSSFSSPFLYMALLGTAEIPAYTITAPITQRLGRRIVITFCLVSCGVLLLLEFSLKLEGVNNEWADLGLIFTSYLLVCTAYQVNFLYASELIPTTLRPVGTSMCCLVGYLGFSIPPLITNALAEDQAWISVAVFGSCSLVAGCLAVLLPETNGRPLPETVADLQDRLKDERLAREEKV